MKMRCFRVLAFAFAIIMMVPLCACASKEPIVTQEELNSMATVEVNTTEEVLSTTEEPIVAEKAINPLTGLECDIALKGKRPLAIMINNIKASLPQFGLSQFDIIHEVLAEGTILRLEAVTLDYQNIKEIGSVRSTRPYYVEISTAYDAFLAHAGGSKPGYNTISKLGVNNIDGLAYEGVTIDGIKTFYRNQERLNNGVSKEHTLFTSGAGLQNAIEKKNYRTDLKDPNFTAFNFDTGFVSLGTQQKAVHIKVPHASKMVSEFKYNESDKLYYHYQYSQEHIDGANNQQIATENVFVIFATHKLTGDSSGTRTVTLTGTGKGYYFACGEAVAITWKRSSESGTFQFFREDGTELKVRCGKSYISIADTKIASKVTIS